VLIICVIAYRLVSTSTPDNLKNYIVKNERIETAYTELKDDFLIYKLNIRSPFALGDTMFIDNVYYLESVGNLQFTVRCKNDVMEELISKYNMQVLSPFKYYLKVSTVKVNDETAETTETEEVEILDFVLLEDFTVNVFGENKDRYKYYTLSFDGVEIDYIKTKVEIYMFLNTETEPVEYDETKADARVTLFDINMPKDKIKPEKLLGILE